MKRRTRCILKFVSISKKSKEGQVFSIVSEKIIYQEEKAFLFL